MFFAPADLEVIVLSVKVAAVATFLSLPVGFLVAAGLGMSRFPGRALVDGVINLPLVLPPVVVGYFLLILLGDNGFFGPILKALGIKIVFNWKGAVVASAVVGFPLLVRSIRLGIESIDEGMFHAARSLGATWRDILFSVVLPQSWRAILVGATLMFARSLGEFGATVMIAGSIPGRTQTIPLAIFDYTNQPGKDANALKLCIVSMALSFSVLLVSEYLARRAKKTVTR
ncbi:MAG: molybdate ABC transporter permease subunit [Deltaproteobacteria bacterium]|nr:MAG: molybdate ABC transporter permease subunit [Deltaproteobacteria bacterium]